MSPLVRGLIQIYTGNGKGKTTAALGLALRARAAGKRVAMVFFDKGGEHYSERKILGELGGDWFAYGLDRIGPKTERFRFGVIPDDVAQAEHGIAKARKLLARSSSRAERGILHTNGRDPSASPQDNTEVTYEGPRPL